MSNYDAYWEDNKTQKKKLVEKTVRQALSEVERKLNEDDEQNFLMNYAKRLIIDQFKSSKFAKVVTKELTDMILNNLKISITINDNFTQSDS